ncbi:MAG: isomerase [Ignavibacteria bacterium RBG_13_36_8]|nr:MAG: isomerase [Ignavibacteria bacterium RBG_13_36_8]
MKLKLYQVDAFTNKLFGGNPAAVCPLEKWLDESVMQNIASENNLSETAFFVKEGNRYHIRWFTPKNEVPLCGHATLASSFVIFNFIEKDINKIFFQSKSGELIVERDSDLLALNFPSAQPSVCEMNEVLLDPFNEKPVNASYAKDTYMLVFENEKQIREMKPDIKALMDVNAHAVIVTAKGDQVDFVSRFFAPKIGIDEDPVTGFAHTLLTPYWSSQLNKKKMHALQISARGGELFVEDLGERVKIAGKAVLYSIGEICL